MDNEIYKFENVNKSQFNYLSGLNNKLKYEGEKLETLGQNIFELKMPIEFTDYAYVSKMLKEIPSLIDEVMYMNAIVLESIKNEDSFSTDDFSSAIKTSSNCIKTINDQINWFEFILKSYTNDLEYDDFDEGTKRVFYLSPNKDVYMSVTYTQTDFILWHSKAKNPVIISFPKIDTNGNEKEQISSFEIPEILEYYTEIVLGNLFINDIHIGTPLKIALKKYVVEWFFKEIVHNDRQYFNLLVNKYFSLLSFQLTNGEYYKFHVDNSNLFDLCHAGNYPKLYITIHEKLRNSLGGEMEDVEFKK